MKKILLSILCLVAVALTGYAAEVTFDFTNPTGLNPSITPAAAQNGVDVSDQTFTNGDITFTATQGTTTDARIWSNNNGTYELRLYKGATITIKSATDPITKITFTGSTLGSTATADGTTAAEEWTGSANEVVYTIADNSGTVKISNIVVSTDKVLDCELTWNETSSAPIQASTSQCKTYWNSSLSTGVNYWVTYDGSEPSADNANASLKTNRNLPFMISTIKKDTIFTMKVRPEKDGVYGKTIERTFYFAYQGSLNSYKGISEMAAGNYVMSVDGAVVRRVDEKANYGELPTVAATSANGISQAFGYFEWTFEATDGGYYIKDSFGRYLYMNGTYNNFNVTSNVPTAGGVWTVDINADGTAKITNVEKQKYIQCYETGGVKTVGCFNNDNGTMPVLGAAFNPVVTTTPADGEAVDSFSKITFYCADGIKVTGKHNYCSLQGKTTTQVASYNQIDDNTVELILESEVTAAGEYTFVTYNKVFTLAPNSVAQQYPATNQNMTITIKGEAAPVVMVVTPENNSTQKSLQHFTFSYETGIYVNNLFGGQAPFLGFTDPTTGNSSQIALTATTATETSVTLSTDKEQTAEGYYTLVVPAEYFVLAGSKPNEAIMNQYMVQAASTDDKGFKFTSVTPKEGVVTELSKIVVVPEVELNNSPSGWTLTDAEGKSYAIETSVASDYWSINVIVEETITAPGTYTLNIPAGNLIEYQGQGRKNAAASFTWTIEAGATEPDYIFNADDYEVAAEFTTLTDGIFTFLQGEGSTKPWIVDASDKKYSNEASTSKRIKPQTPKNYLTADIPAAGKLVFGVHSSNSDATDRTLSVKQNDVELYGKVVSEADKVDGVHKVHEVAVEAGLATITMPVNTLNFSYIEFVPGGEQEEGIKATWSMEEGAVIESFESVTLTIEGEGIETVQALYDTHFSFYEKDAEGNYNLTTPNPGFQSNGYMNYKASGTSITFTVDPEIFSSDYTSPFARKGDYRIVVPVGGIYFNGDKANKNTEEYVLNFTIDNDIVELEEIDANFTADPKNNSTVSEIREITLTFTDYKSVTVAEPDLNMFTNIPLASMIDPEFGYASPVGYVMFRAGKVENQLVLYVDPTYAGADAFTVEGDYAINVPKGVVTFSDGINKAFTLNYTVKAGVVESTEVKFLSVNPEEGKVESLSFIQIITDTDLGSVDGCKLTDANGKEYEIEQYPENKDESDSNYESIIIVPSEEITAAGTYTLTVPAGAAIEFIQDATVTPKTNAATSYTWTIEGESVKEDLYITEADPAEGSTIRTKWDEVIVTWNKNIDMTYDGQCYVLDAEGNKVSDADGTYVYDENHVCIDNQLKFIIKTPIVEAEGEYTLVIVAGYVFDMADYTNVNEEIRLTYHVSNSTAINSIKVDAVNGYVVYNLNGHRVMQTKKAADLYRLENGLYIINGQKVILNK